MHWSSAWEVITHDPHKEPGTKPILVDPCVTPGSSLTVLPAIPIRNTAKASSKRRSFCGASVYKHWKVDETSLEPNAIQCLLCLVGYNLQRWQEANVRNEALGSCGCRIISTTVTGRRISTTSITVMTLPPGESTDSCLFFARQVNRCADTLQFLFVSFCFRLAFIFKD